jgi:hypothetical protein
MFATGTRTRFVRFFAAPLLILWISGAGCIFGCESASANQDSVKAESCEAHHTHDCCVKKNKVAARKALPETAHLSRVARGNSSDIVESCPLAINANAAVSKARPSEVALATVHDFLQSTTAGIQLFRSQPLTVLNRSGTHLRCCVFLI